jgi:hypothetical protein
MIYYLDWRNCLVTAAYNYFKIIWDCQQILVRCSPIKSAQLVSCSSILKFNQQKHTTRGMEFNIKVQSTKAHNLCGMEFNNIQHTVQYLAL